MDEPALEESLFGHPKEGVRQLLDERGLAVAKATEQARRAEARVAELHGEIAGCRS